MRNIPIQIQDSLDSGVTSLCYLLKFTTKNGLTFGVTSLDVDFTFDDGDGELVYSSVIGLNQKGLPSSEGLEVPNSESTMLFIESTAFNEQDVQNGLLDYASYKLMRVDWQHPEYGYFIPPNGTGTAGAVKPMDGISGVIELRGIPQQLKQTFVELYSLTCRADFGSIQGPQVRFPCNFNLTSLWENGAVASVGAEPDVEFVTALPTPTGPLGDLTYVPGVVEFTSGNNAGAVIEIESYESNVMTLKFPAEYPIEAGDTLRARPDCAKRYVEDCKDKYDNVLNYRGEYLIPVTDEGPASTPGATYPGFGTGVVPGYIP